MALTWNIKLLLLLYVCICQISCHPILYVSSEGTDNNNQECSQQQPCGTIFNAWVVRENTSYANIDKVEIMVLGINKPNITLGDITNTADMSCCNCTEPVNATECAQSQSCTDKICDDDSYCCTTQWDSWCAQDALRECFDNRTDQYLQPDSPYYNYIMEPYYEMYITLPLIVTFNTSQDPGWYSIFGYLSSPSATLTINNLIYTSPEYELWGPSIYAIRQQISLFEGTLILNNCSFTNVFLYDESTSFIAASSVEIYGSIFSNITMSRGLPGYYYDGQQGFITIYSAAFFGGDNNFRPNNVIDNSIFNNIYLPSSVHFLAGMVLQQVTIENSEISDIYLDEDKALFYFTAYFLLDNDPTARVSINNSAFMNINYGALMIVHSGNVIMENSRIISSNSKENIITVTAASKIAMDNITLTYEVMDRFMDICYAYYSGGAECNVSAPFLFNEGYVSMSNIFVTNDITEMGLNEYRDYWVDNRSLDNDTMLEFYFRSDGLFDIGHLMYNGGILNITDYTIYGIGVYPTTLLNLGTAIITGLNISRPDFVWDNSDFINPRDFFWGWPFEIMNAGSAHKIDDISCNDQVLEHCIVDESNINSQGILLLQNSIITGRGAVLDSEGYVGIYNTLITHTPYIVIGIDSVSFNVVDCVLENVGDYHLGDSHIYVYYNATKQRDIDYRFALINVGNAVIKDNIFNYFAETGYVFIKNEIEMLQTHLIIENNTFVNPIDLESFNFGHFGPEIEYIFNYFNITDSDDKINKIKKLYRKYKRSNDHLVILEGYIKSSFIGNTFSHNDLYTTILLKSCLYVDGYDINGSSHCVSGNVFYGSAFIIYNAQINSCLHPQLSVNEDTQCWDESKSLIRNDLIANNYINKMIVTDFDINLLNILDGSQVVLDETLVSISSTLNSSEYELTYNPISTEMDGSISILDMIISDDKTHEIQIGFHRECDNLCTQLYQNLLHNIHQLHIKCNGSMADTTNMIGLSDSLSLSSVNHTLPSQVFLTSSHEIFPGGTLDLTYSILDSYNNIINDWEGEIFIVLTSEDFDFETIAHIDWKGKCDICLTGLYIQSVRLDRNRNKQYTIKTYVQDNLLSVNDLNVTVKECPSGYGLNEISSQCYECGVGEFSIGTSTEPCMSCTVGNRGVDCIGGDRIMISQNYWIGINLDMINRIVSKHCPSNYCSQEHGQYLELQQSNKLCALNRNTNTPLCGKCNEGFSEVFGSSNCALCERHRWELWIAGVVCSILFAVLMVWLNGKIINRKHSIHGRIESCMPGILPSFVKVAMLKPLLYYYQSLIFIFVNTGITLQLLALAELFNFQFDAFGVNSNGAVSGYCWVPGLTAKYEIMLNLTVPIFCVFVLILMALIYRIIPYSLCGKQPYFIKSFVNILLLVIGTICYICFKLIACRDIGEQTVHFYFGSEECYDGIWYFGLLAMIIFVIIFVLMFYKLYIDHKDLSKIEQSEYILESLVKSFKSESYYWEGIMFSRRFIIAMINVVLSDNETSHNILFVLIAIYFTIQLYYKPFKIDEVNTVENACLLCLLLVLYILANDHREQSDGQNIFSVLLLNVLMIIPLIVFFKQFYNIFKSHRNTIKKQKSNLMDLVQHATSPRLGATTISPRLAVELRSESDDEDGNARMTELVSPSIPLHIIPKYESEDVGTSHEKVMNKSCTDCGVFTSNGKIYEGDGSYYCLDCWDAYKD